MANHCVHCKGIGGWMEQEPRRDRFAGNISIWTPCEFCAQEERANHTYTLDELETQRAAWMKRATDESLTEAERLWADDMASEITQEIWGRVHGDR